MEEHQLVTPLLYCSEPISDDLLFDLNVIPVEISSVVPSNQAYLHWDGKGLFLISSAGLKISVNLADSKYQRAFQPSQELLCRACGWHLGMRDVLDLTAGLGVDSIMLAQAGYQVTAIERNPLLALLLRWAHRGIEQNEAKVFDYKKRLCFNFGEAQSYLHEASQLPSVIYYDPMYPAKKKAALPSKEMQVLREINGSNEESRELVELALKLGVKRLVVKRPHRAPPIRPHPTTEFSSKLVRFDVYISK
ncbi:MAG: hypothetical protein RJB66_2497 [Pseudomonadota bacterium]